MRWPPWSSSVTNSDGSIDPSKPSPRPLPPSSWSSPALPNDWRHYLSPSVVIPTAIMTSTILVGRRLYKIYLRRIPGAANIAPSYWRKRSLLGTVTSVGDGDGFRLFHTPGGRLAGWGWFPGRRVPKVAKDLKGKTVRACT